MKKISVIIIRTLAVIVLLFYLLVFFLGMSDCNWYMPGPCPEGWDPINECIKGEDEDCPGKVLYNCKEIPEGSWRCD